MIPPEEISRGHFEAYKLQPSSITLIGYFHQRTLVMGKFDSTVPFPQRLGIWTCQVVQADASIMRPYPLRILGMPFGFASSIKQKQWWAGGHCFRQQHSGAREKVLPYVLRRSWLHQRIRPLSKAKTFRQSDDIKSAGRLPLAGRKYF